MECVEKHRECLPTLAGSTGGMCAAGWLLVLKLSPYPKRRAMKRIGIVVWVSILVSGILPVHATVQPVDMARRVEELKALKWGMSTG